MAQTLMFTGLFRFPRYIIAGMQVINTNLDILSGKLINNIKKESQTPKC